MNDIPKANEVEAMQKYAFPSKMCVFFIGNGNGNGFDVVNIANFLEKNLSLSLYAKLKASIAFRLVKIK